MSTLFAQPWAAYLIGLVATLVLASSFTPRHWWLRPNLRALSVLAGGSYLIGSLLLWRSSDGMAAPPIRAQAATPANSHDYRVFKDLNLRGAAQVGAARVVVVPAGTLVHASGLRDGDWWQVSVDLGGRHYTGWASSLWLRRTDEGQSAHRARF